MTTQLKASLPSLPSFKHHFSKTPIHTHARDFMQNSKTNSANSANASGGAEEGGKIQTYIHRFLPNLISYMVTPNSQP